MKPLFTAFVHEPDSKAIVDEFRASYRPVKVSEYDLADGILTLFTWAKTEPIADREGTLLVTLDKSGSAADVPPTSCRPAGRESRR